MTTWAYILVDLENVQPEAGTIQRLHEGVRVLIFAKAEDKITIDVAKILMREPCNEFVLTSSTGKNAADFHIACQLGILSRDAPSSTVYLTSSPAFRRGRMSTCLPCFWAQYWVRASATASTSAPICAWSMRC